MTATRIAPKGAGKPGPAPGTRPGGKSGTESGTAPGRKGALKRLAQGKGDAPGNSSQDGMRQSARDRIIDTALRLFYQDGYRATGIDRIIAESGVAKMSLYRHFSSKDELISAFLDARHDAWMDWFRTEMTARLARRRELGAIADALGAWFRQDDFRGCAFINVVAEAGQGENTGHVRQAAEHKDALADYVVALAKELGLRKPAAVADEAMLCIEGMIVRFQMTGDPGVVKTGRRMLERIEREA
jgi:AcrR family transcriptional regulator